MLPDSGATQPGWVRLRVRGPWWACGKEDVPQSKVDLTTRCSVGPRGPAPMPHLEVR